MIRALIVSDIRLYLEGLSGILNEHASVEIVGTCESVSAAIQFLKRAKPTVILQDMAMANSLSAVKTMRQLAPSVLIIALGVHEIPKEVISCAEAGVSSYVTRKGSSRELLQAVLDTVKGELRCSPKIASSLFRQVGRLSARKNSIEEEYHLTNRELEVARLIDLGLSNKEIAAQLFIEVSTVKNHVHNLLAKLNVNRRGEAASRIRPLLVEQAIHPAVGMESLKI